MANRGKTAGKKTIVTGKPSDSRAGKRGTGTNVWEPGFPNWDII